MGTGWLARSGQLVARGEDAIGTVAATGVIVLPLINIALGRIFRTGIAGAAPLTAHLTLVVGLVGASIAAREGRLLTIATGTWLPEGRARRWAAIAVGFVTTLVLALLFAGATQLLDVHREAQKPIAFGIPVWVADTAFLVAFALIAVRTAWKAAAAPAGRIVAAMGAVAGAWVVMGDDALVGTPPWLWIGLLVGAAVLGMPIFALFGGLAAVLFLVQGDSPANVIIGGYDQLTSTDLPAILLFALAGCLLAEGRAPERLLRFFRAWVGWMPGGTAVVTVMLCAFFTLLTGGSGITILAVGGVLLPTLLADGYRERFSHGLLVSAGSLGILFPPSLPLFLYGIVAGVPIRDLFIGGLLPGALMIAALAALAVREGLIVRGSRQRFVWGEALAATWAAKWEVFLPVVVVAALLGGATTVQTSAVAALFALVAQRFVHRDVRDWQGLRRVTSASISLVGGVLIILAVAVGFTNYLIDADVPSSVIAWTQANVHSKWLFLLGLNFFLIVVGGMMDIFSTIIVIVPLIIPIARHFGVDPVHLGIIFVANAELGYLTPPVGENLFVASQRFNKPLLQLARAALPMYIVILIGTLLITYIPWLTRSLVDYLQ
jgi:tripartite ATP-independent transporter DctM subunit